MVLRELQIHHKNTLDNDKKIEIKELQNEIEVIYSEENDKKLIFLNKVTMKRVGNHQSA